MSQEKRIELIKQLLEERQELLPKTLWRNSAFRRILRVGT